MASTPLASVEAGHQGGIRLEQGNNILRVSEATGPGRIFCDDGLWGNCPLVNGLLRPGYAVLYDEPFECYNAAATTGDWVLTQATAGTAAISTTTPGALTLDTGDSTIHHGVNLQRLKAAFIPAANKSLWFEATVVLGTALDAEIFIGLSGSNTAIISAGSLVTAAKNLIGFSSTTGDAVMLFNSVKAGVANTPPASPVTLSLTVAHRLGFFYDGLADTVQAFVDGVAVGAAIATANVPKVAMYPSFVCQNQAGVDEPTMTISALRVFQLR